MTSPQPSIIAAEWMTTDAAEAEDGRGARIPADQPIALEIRAEGWRGRALDPVLHVDERHFHHYSHPGPGLIRYELANASS